MMLPPIEWVADRLRWLVAPWRELSELQVAYLRLQVHCLQMAKRLAELEARVNRLS